MIHAAQLAQEALDLADGVGVALLKTKKVGQEATVVTTNQMTMSVQSQTPNEVATKKFGEKSAVSLPAAEELLGGEERGLLSLGVQVSPLARSRFALGSGSMWYRSITRVATGSPISMWD